MKLSFRTVESNEQIATSLDVHPSLREQIRALVQTELDRSFDSDWFIELVDQRIAQTVEILHEENNA